jgi:hypothetical protein
MQQMPVLNYSALINIFNNNISFNSDMRENSV